MTGVNQHGKSTSCVTCSGDRFVIVLTRPVKQSSWLKEHDISPPANAAIDEYAPCPVCNAELDTSFHRYDGTPVRSPDPARVRQMLKL